MQKITFLSISLLLSGMNITFAESTDFTPTIHHPNIASITLFARPQQITTRDGGSYLGFVLGKEGATLAYVGPDGKKFKIRKVDIVKREEIPVSLMPPALIYNMSAREIRDLLAYLLNGGE